MKKLLAILSFATPLFGMHDEREHVERILNPLAAVSAITVEATPSDSITTNQNYKMTLDFLLNPADRVQKPVATARSTTASSLHIFNCSHLGCIYKTRRSGDLKRHLLTHSNAKPFKCTQCDYVTKWKCNLISHLRTHSDEKPFKCAQCNYATRWQSALIQHMYKHSDGNLFKCDQCDFATKFPLYLTKHIRRKHTTQPSPNQSEMEIAS